MGKPLPGKALSLGCFIGESQGKSEEPDLRGGQSHNEDQRLLAASFVTEGPRRDDAADQEQELEDDSRKEALEYFLATFDRGTVCTYQAKPCPQAISDFAQVKLVFSEWIAWQGADSPGNLDPGDQVS